MTTLDDPANASVLLVGGGDWIAVDHLREYDVTVDQVDLDREFMQYAKDDPLLEQFHDDAYEYDRLETTHADAYDYLRRTDKTYDLVILDLPGARSDEMLPLYSQEFYTLLREQLTDRGVVVTWAYARYDFPRHHKAYTNTVRAAGFDYYLPYRAVGEVDDTASVDTTETFYMLSPDKETPLRPNRSQSDYVRRYADRYEAQTWQPTPRYRGVRPNSVVHPNYDIIVRI